MLNFLFLAGFLFFLVFKRGHVFFDSDGVNYGLGLFHYNLSLYRPHPLGDPLYLFFGSLFYRLFQDPVFSLWILSFLSYLLILFLSFFLLKEEKKKEGFFLPLLSLASSPLLVKMALIVNPDIWEGALFLFALLLWERPFPREKEPLLFFLFGFFLGFRLTLFYYLSLFFLALFYRLYRERNIKPALFFLFGIALWLFPFLGKVGGVGAYLEVLPRREEQISLSVMVEGLPALWRNLQGIAEGLLFGLGGMLFLLPLGFSEFKAQKKVCLILLFPAFLYFLFVLCNTSSFLIGTTALFLLFVLRAQGTIPALFILPLFLNFALLFSFVFPAIKSTDVYWKHRIACVKKHFSPEKTLLYFYLEYGKTSYFFYRHALFYLPEYDLLFKRGIRQRAWWFHHKGETAIEPAFPEEALQGKTFILYGNEDQGKGKLFICKNQKFFIQSLLDFKKAMRLE